jgi:hypothetical protein
MLKQIPARRYGLIDSKSLSDIIEIFKGLPEFQYPINSAGELVEKLGGPDASVNILGVPVSVRRLGKGMPAGYFPIASLENFVEKMATLVRRSRPSLNLLREIGHIRPYLPAMKFPMQSVDDLLRAFQSVESLPATSPRLPPQHSRTVDGAKVRAWISHHMRPKVFPIQTEEDLYHKALGLIPKSSHMRG